MTESMTKSMTKATAARLLLDGLAEQGIAYLFCNLGTDHVTLIEELADPPAGNAPWPRPILCPHETVAVHMAGGVAATSTAASVASRIATWSRWPSLASSVTSVPRRRSKAFTSVPFTYRNQRESGEGGEELAAGWAKGQHGCARTYDPGARRQA